MEQGEQIFIFRKFMMDEDEVNLEEYHSAAIDKLQTLFPGKQVTSYDLYTIGIESDSLYSDTGIDTYELGLVDWEIPAMRNVRSGEVLTFNVR